MRKLLIMIFLLGLLSNGVTAATEDRESNQAFPSFNDQRLTDGFEFWQEGSTIDYHQVGVNLARTFGMAANDNDESSELLPPLRSSESDDDYQPYPSNFQDYDDRGSFYLMADVSPE